MIFVHNETRPRTRAFRAQFITLGRIDVKHRPQFAPIIPLNLETREMTPETKRPASFKENTVEPKRQRTNIGRDALIQIMIHLDLEQIIVCMRVCKSWYQDLSCPEGPTRWINSRNFILHTSPDAHVLSFKDVALQMKNYTTRNFASARSLKQFHGFLTFLQSGSSADLKIRAWLTRENSILITKRKIELETQRVILCT